MSGIGAQPAAVRRVSQPGPQAGAALPEIPYTRAGIQQMIAGIEERKQPLNHPNRFSERPLTPGEMGSQIEEVTAQPLAAAPVRLPNQQPTIDQTEAVARPKPPISISPELPQLEAIAFLVPHLRQDVEAAMKEAEVLRGGAHA
ncbi:MAG: hypothetical protein KJ811_03630 [Candidatus Margulisbacteria bacterium]|nr:hypothetical protein [Candidatus Margulisiibacteriota bacterium]